MPSKDQTQGNSAAKCLRKAWLLSMVVAARRTTGQRPPTRMPGVFLSFLMNLGNSPQTCVLQETAWYPEDEECTFECKHHSGPDMEIVCSQRLLEPD